MEHLIVELCSILDVSKFHVKKFNNKIFICGGELSKRASKRHPSIRDFFIKEIKEKSPEIYKRLVLAEDVNQWFGDKYYDDLLELEKDLAELVTGIPIFVESAGSLAELGAFSMAPQIRKKLLVFISKEHYEARSFIHLGPLKKIGDSLIRPYDFNNGNKRTYTAEFFESFKDYVREDIEESFLNNDCKIDFKSDVTAHLIFLICDLIFIAGSVKRKEIDQMLELILGYKIETEILSKCLWVATQMNMLEKIVKGEKYYCVPNDLEGEYLSFSYKTGVDRNKKERARWRSKFIKEIKLDKRRFEALAEVSKDNE